MNPLEERLNDHLDYPATLNGQHPGNLLLLEAESTSQADLRELFVLAQHLRQHSQVQVKPDFARQLERRMLHRHAELRLQRGRGRFSWRTLFRAHRVLGSALAVCLICCVFGTSLLALAAQTSSPSNPLYGLKRWEQQLQSQFASPDNQVALHLELARDDLNTLSSLATTKHFQEYDQAVRDLDQQIQEVDVTITGVPAGTSHDHLIHDFARLKLDMHRTLYLLLPALPFQERLITTSALANIGDAMPRLTSATMILPARSQGSATISLEGINIATNAQLVIDGSVIRGLGTLRDGLLTFEINWDGNQHPQSLGILNPDGTAAQIIVITIKQSATSGKSNGNSSGKNNGNKPTSTPTPNENKPSSTPTPNGNKPSSTPTPHH